MAFILITGLCMLGLGIGGILYAPAILEAQRKRGATPVRAEAIGQKDRLRATRGVGVAFAVFGGLLIAYAVL
ncbi:hypothetical protein [Halostagnicola bangensis]